VLSRLLIFASGLACAAALLVLAPPLRGVWLRSWRREKVSVAQRRFELKLCHISHICHIAARAVREYFCGRPEPRLHVLRDSADLHARSEPRGRITIPQPGYIPPTSGRKP